jgi:hypothetical protein
MHRKHEGGWVFCHSILALMQLTLLQSVLDDKEYSRRMAWQAGLPVDRLLTCYFFALVLL